MRWHELQRVARLSGWRWRPWPAGSDGYRSPITEAKMMSETIAGNFMIPHLAEFAAAAGLVLGTGGYEPPPEQLITPTPDA